MCFLTPLQYLTNINSRIMHHLIWYTFFMLGIYSPCNCVFFLHNTFCRILDWECLQIWNWRPDRVYSIFIHCIIGYTQVRNYYVVLIKIYIEFNLILKLNCFAGIFIILLAYKNIIFSCIFISIWEMCYESIR